MPRKPKLPGAADFFAIGESAPGSSAPAHQAAEHASRTTARASSHPELLPCLTIPEGPTEKVTFYLNPLLLKRLELYKAQLLVEQNLKVNRSQIVDFLLEEGLRHAESLTEGLLARAE
jgi:hypothetical protein